MSTATRAILTWDQSDLWVSSFLAPLKDCELGSIAEVHDYISRYGETGACFASICGSMANITSREALPFIVSVFDHDSLALLLGAGSTLGRIGSRRVTRDLIERLRHGPTPNQQIGIAHALGELRDRRSIGCLLELLRNLQCHESVRDEAAEALAGFVGRSDRRVLQGLFAASADPSPSVRWTVAWALRRARSHEAISVLAALLNDQSTPPGNTTVAEIAMESLGCVRERLGV